MNSKFKTERNFISVFNGGKKNVLDVNTETENRERKYSQEKRES